MLVTNIMLKVLFYLEPIFVNKNVQIETATGMCSVKKVLFFW